MKKRPKSLTLEEIRAGNGVVHAPCKLGLYLRTHPEDVKVVFAAIADPTIQCSAIYKSISVRGYTGGDEMLRRHRKGVCVTCREWFGWKR